MKKEAQRIAIARACGWEGIKLHWVYHSDTSTEGCNTLKGLLDGSLKVVPDYLNDLNAMHEAEKVLDNYQIDQYIYELDEIFDPEKSKTPLATAAQRAEAFLKTLNLWTD